MLGIAEDDYALVSLSLDKTQSRLRLLQRGHGQTVLIDVRTVLQLGFDGDLNFIPLIHPGNGHNFLRNGCGKQTQIFAVLHFFDDLGNILEETHIQHPVCLI